MSKPSKSKPGKRAVETRLAASLSDPGKLVRNAGIAEDPSFVSGHRFSDAANRKRFAAPFAAEGQASKRKLATTFLTLALFTVAVAFAGQSSPNSNAQLPAGPMQEKAAAACSSCHEARIIVQQRLTKPAWTKEVDKMIKWGAEVDPKDRDALIDYFTANFGPDQPTYAAPRTATDSQSQTKTKK
jgi:hypothetical protein